MRAFKHKEYLIKYEAIAQQKTFNLIEKLKKVKDLRKNQGKSQKSSQLRIKTTNGLISDLTFE
ncbi:MAG TPA: hypothetical protein DD379_00745 [Cyanobacteria bacterium UBA11162]|nr:hypothetical protein [Cyanobacteria bacterium UBA11162]